MEKTKAKQQLIIRNSKKKNLLLFFLSFFLFHSLYSQENWKLFKDEKCDSCKFDLVWVYFTGRSEHHLRLSLGDSVIYNDSIIYVPWKHIGVTMDSIPLIIKLPIKSASKFNFENGKWKIDLIIEQGYRFLIIERYKNEYWFLYTNRVTDFK